MKLHTAFYKLPGPAIYPWGIHTNRRSMISGILSARHTGSLAFWLLKNCLIHFSERDQGAPPSPNRSVFLKNFLTFSFTIAVSRETPVTLYKILAHYLLFV